jgi:ribonucleoside-diphosphate reductase alpha chain
LLNGIPTRINVRRDLKENKSFGGHAHRKICVRPDSLLEARVKGYEGESCTECGNFTLVRNGTCLKCDTCGGTSGCS